MDDEPLISWTKFLPVAQGQVEVKIHDFVDRTLELGCPRFMTADLCRDFDSLLHSTLVHMRDRQTDRPTDR
jgi:hypothetical protein